MKTISKPLYVKLYDEILQNIKSKKYSCCDKLPSENIFAKEFGVNRHTVRQALSLLKDEGFIYTVKGKGNYISNIQIPYSISDKSSFSQKIMDLGYEPKTKLLSADIVKPSEYIAKQLGLNSKVNVIELKLLRYVNDLPIAVSFSYFDAFYYREIIDNLNMEPFSLYNILNKCYPEMEITKISTVFEAQNPTNEISDYLMMPTNTPVIVASTLSKNQYGEFVEYGSSYSRADAVKIKVDLV
ncbi:hypothetical protein CRV08_01800 [Halarcobacter ebronensis]|uniref:HTH gntR-type domain-containing protein n=1 Tax=Halarcobacter ebronensis TaxID=1462615 RepID=A0A4Q0YIV3_9BACT|nr:GntR family transcriptional regulator [Halarcobacter ebronensis]RXJ70323.1 hypothetical protein CRV08_01800 [Halarcobacter ebronensis]